ncbi:MAG: D-glycero-beta-D-manno-heptose 1-phosphate adenylyltransferase [Planctomycetota bacterium]|nr:MAG: D-glycero-beta-D-manno-heptose 1-phosphate adenylyltransferase [Planctomycetota bacterium]
MSLHDLAHLTDDLGCPKVLVVGDLILDRYTWGDAQRVSQEAPVIVLRSDRREARPGGAANVANMLLGLGAEVSCVGVVGDDAAGGQLRQMLIDAGAECRAVVGDESRPTSTKERFIGRAGSRHPSQILRVDHEVNHPVDTWLENDLINWIESHAAWHDAILISDYGKGVCTPRVLQAAIQAARLVAIPVIVDPSVHCPLEHYRGATMIKPNRAEAERATGITIKKPDDAMAAGKHLCQQIEAGMALVTLDSDGMMLVERSGYGEFFSTHARAVYDITGAGDMVMAAVGLCLAAGTSPDDAVRLANVAAGLEVERTGVSVVARDELRAELIASQHGGTTKIVSHEHIGRIAGELHSRGQSIVLTNGCFDLLHVGHVAYLEEAARLANVLVVGVNSDTSVRRLKGESRPVIAQSDRAAMLAALGCVDYVVVFDEDTPHRLIEAVRPDVLVKGGTYRPEEVVGHEIVEAYGGQVRVTGVVDGISTTNILASLTRGETVAATETSEDEGPQVHPHPNLRRAS